MDAPKQGDGLSQPSLLRLTEWLGSRRSLEGPLTASLIVGGRSNLTYLLSDGTSRFVLRRPPAGQLLRGAHDVGREHRIVAALNGRGVPVAAPVAFCEATDILGSEFSVVSYVDGETLRKPSDLERLSQEGRQDLTTNFATTLADLHQLDPELSGMVRSKGDDFVHRQLHVWRRQLQAEPVRELPVMDEVADQLSRTAPPQPSVAIVHGDYRLDNVMVGQDGTLRAILDWELWTLGDPLADLGTALTYWVESPFEPLPLGASPTTSSSLGSRVELLTAYEEAGGVIPSGDVLSWYTAFGTWRFAAILEGIYRRKLAGSYGDEGDDHWQRNEHIVPLLAELAHQHLTM